MSIWLQLSLVLLFAISLAARGISLPENCARSVATVHYSVTLQTDFSPDAILLRSPSPGSALVLHGDKVTRLEASGIPMWDQTNPFHTEHCTENTCQIHEMQHQSRPLVMVSQLETESFAIFDTGNGARLFSDTFGPSNNKTLNVHEIKTDGPHALLLYADSQESTFELNWALAETLNSPATFFRCTERPVYGFTTYTRSPFIFPSDLTNPRSVKALTDKNIIQFDRNQFKAILEAGENRLIDAFVIDSDNIYVAVENHSGMSVWKLGESRPRYSTVGTHRVKFQAQFLPGRDRSAANLRGLRVAAYAYDHLGVYDLFKNETVLSYYSPALNVGNVLLSDDGKILVAETGNGGSRRADVFRLDTYEMIAAFNIGRAESSKLLDMVTITDRMGTGKPPYYSLLVSSNQGVVNWFLRPELFDN